MSVNDLNFTVLGPSGSGKTTLLSCMNKSLSEVLSGVSLQNGGGGMSFLRMLTKLSKTKLTAVRLNLEQQ